jgi:hypothetical protein
MTTKASIPEDFQRFNFSPSLVGQVDIQVSVTQAMVFPFVKYSGTTI